MESIRGHVVDKQAVSITARVHRISPATLHTNRFMTHIVTVVERIEIMSLLVSVQAP